MALRILRCSARRAEELREQLVGLLHDAVDDGASVGFLPPLSALEARSFWHGVEQAIAHGDRELLVAERDGELVGAVQLAMAPQANARHRAEVSKLLVRSTARRQGIAGALMREVEELARGHGRTLLVLDTAGDVAERLYRRLGYLAAGTIPGYARSAQGTLEATVIFYKVLSAP